MSTKKTAKHQTVTFYRQSPWWRPASIENETGTVTRQLESIAVYDTRGVICKLDSCELGDTLRDGATLEMSLPIIWKTFSAPDFTERRAHLVSRVFIDEKKYTLFIPVEAVTINPCAGYSVSKSAGRVCRFFAVEGFPRKFDVWCFHPFPRYEMIHELEALQKDQYRILTADDITTPYARERIEQFFAKLEEYTAEAERIQTLSEDDYIRECNAIDPRFIWQDGYFKQA